MAEMIRTGIVIVHIASGTAALAAGVGAMIGRKGGKNHSRWGLLYFWAMFGIFVSALGLIAFRPNIFMFTISILSFYSALTGYRSLFRKTGGAGRIDWAASLIALPAGLGVMAWGGLVLAGLLAFPQEMMAFAILGIIFGAMLAHNAATDLRSYRRPPSEKSWWLFYHLDRMLGSYIGAATAFTVQNVGRQLPDELVWIAWVAPALIGMPAIAYWTRTYRRKLSAVRSKKVTPAADEPINLAELAS